MNHEEHKGHKEARWTGLTTMMFVLIAVPVIVFVQSGTGQQSGARSEWLVVGGDWHNSRFSNLTQITTQNVAKLGGAWMSPKFDAAASTRAMPVVKDGMMFVTVPP